MGSLSNKNEAAAEEQGRRIECLLSEAGYTVAKRMNLDCGGRIGLIVENPDAVTYSQAQVASGEAHELEAVRAAGECELEAVNGRLA